jgi:hypothetical protein
MQDLIRKVYNFYAPALIVIWLTFSGHWVWLLGAIGLLIVVISNNIEAQLQLTARAMDEFMRRLETRNSHSSGGSCEPKL